MQATFGKQVLYIEKFSLYFFKETGRRERRPLLFYRHIERSRKAKSKRQGVSRIL